MASLRNLVTQKHKLYIEPQVINQRFAPQEFILVAYEQEGEVFFSEGFFSNYCAAQWGL